MKLNVPFFLNIFMGTLLVAKSVRMEEICKEEYFLIDGFRDFPVYWYETTSSTKYISSTCFDDKKHLVFRQCLDREGWSPDKGETESQCKLVMPAPRRCPASVQTIVDTTDVCEHIYSEDMNRHYGTSFTFLDLNAEERKLLMKNYRDHDVQVDTVRIPAYYRWPNKPITRSIDYLMEDWALQLNVAGRYGLVVQFNSSTIRCTDENDYCEQMCLAVKVDLNYLSTELVMEDCSKPNDFSIMTRISYLIRSYVCIDGYYRFVQRMKDPIEECFAVKKFSSKVDITDETNIQNIIESYCQGKMMDMKSNDHHVMFMHLSRTTGLDGSDRCLFQLQSRNVIRYSDWDDLNHSDINFVPWDPFTNPKTIQNLQHSILTINSAGHWTWENDSISCIVCMDSSVSIRQPSIDIKFNLFERRVEVNVTNEDFWYRYADEHVGFQCYAVIDYIDGVSAEYKTELKVNASDRSIDEYVVENVGSGIYWCAGQKIYDTDTQIETDKIFAYFPVFVVRVEQKCSIECNVEDLIDELLTIFDLHPCLNPVAMADSCGSAIIQRRDENSTSLHATYTVRLTVILYDEPVKDSIISLTNEQFQTLRIYEKLQKFTYDPSEDFNVISVRSTDFCLHDSMSSLELIVWGIGHIGESFSPPICDFQTGVSLPSRICVGDKENGVMWQDQAGNQCYSSVSRRLFELFVLIEQDPFQITDVIANVSSTLDDFDGTLFPVDVFVISRIVEKIANIVRSNQTSLEVDDLEEIFKIFNNVSASDDHFLKISSNLNSTNILLESLDELLLSNMKHPIDDLPGGFASIETPLLLNYVTEPLASDVSGIALFSGQDNWLNDFTNSSSRYIYENESLWDIIKDDGFVIGAKIPEEIRGSQSKITFTLFSSDHLFHSTPSGRTYRANGKVISISMCCSLTLFSTGSVIQIFFKLMNQTSESMCRYWDFTSIEGWSSDGCELGGHLDVNGERVIFCNCLHLTHFGNVLSKDVRFDRHHERVLNIITLIGCSLSSVGVLGIYLTAVTFSNFRQKSSAKILLHFATSILLQMILMFVIDVDEKFLSEITGHESSCISLGVFLHFSILANFLWMLIISCLQFQRYVIVFNKFYVKRVVLKSALLGWGCPLIPIAIVLLCDCKLYVPFDQKYFCYPTGQAFYFGLVLPIGLIMLGNAIVFISVLRSICDGDATSQAGKVVKNDLRLLKLRLLVFLFFVLGMTWIFGFLSGVGEKDGLIFSYIFCTSATMQGFVLFVYCIILDTGTRNLWSSLIRKYCQKKW
ncbi:hypothetical protein HA402_013669 [Bradysia odoriphaga]|nr:hypothetical protein HA402_013669 [Bradysia odoriphaga]